MSTERTLKFPQPIRVHRSSLAADERKMRSLGAHIFAELLPHSTASIETIRPASRLTLDEPSWLQLDQTLIPFDTTTQDPHPSIPWAGKEILPMKVYRTESRYYFSSKQLLPAGSLVFFSDKLRRYVHPTAGTLLDPHPRLQLLSEAETQEFEKHWQETLSRV